jgi:enoyl-CoA hydratase/carnithine racemase/enamine deaminase RidA (YjgF/YER057c/UK114 family)
MSDDLCLYAVEDGVATISFNRPERNNGMTGDMELRYLTLLQEAAADPAVRAIVVTGTGKAFCPGADLGRARVEGEEPLPNSKLAVTLALTIDKPIVAAINGACAGVGVAHALFCDVRIAAAGARFTTAFARRGLIAEYGLAWILPRVAGRGVALDLLMSARVFTSEEALAMGLVNRVVPAGDVVAEATAYARDLAANVSPASMATIKRQVGRYETSYDLPGALEDSHALMRQSLTGPDVGEGINSWLEKRPAAFPPLGEGTRYPWMEPKAPAGTARSIAPAGLAPAAGFSHVVEAAGGRRVHIAGQVATDEAGNVVGAGDLAAQTAQAFANVERALAAVGMSGADVTELTYYVVGLDPDKVAAFGTGAVQARKNGVKMPRAAATMVGVTALVSPDYLVEISAVAER